MRITVQVQIDQEMLNLEKFIKANSSVLGIREIRSGAKVIDDNGNKTTSSEWEIL